jgi:hypothetical protein
MEKAEEGEMLEIEETVVQASLLKLRVRQLVAAYLTVKRGKWARME